MHWVYNWSYLKEAIRQYNVGMYKDASAYIGSAIAFSDSPQGYQFWKDGRGDLEKMVPRPDVLAHLIAMEATHARHPWVLHYAHLKNIVYWGMQRRWVDAGYCIAHDTLNSDISPQGRDWWRVATQELRNGKDRQDVVDLCEEWLRVEPAASVASAAPQSRDRPTSLKDDQVKLFIDAHAAKDWHKASYHMSMACSWALSPQGERFWRKVDDDLTIYGKPRDDVVSMMKVWLTQKPVAPAPVPQVTVVASVVAPVSPTKKKGPGDVVPTIFERKSPSSIPIRRY